MTMVRLAEGETLATYGVTEGHVYGVIVPLPGQDPVVNFPLNLAEAVVLRVPDEKWTEIATDGCALFDLLCLNHVTAGRAGMSHAVTVALYDRGRQSEG